MIQQKSGAPRLLYVLFPQHSIIMQLIDILDIPLIDASVDYVPKHVPNHVTHARMRHARQLPRHQKQERNAKGLNKSTYKDRPHYQRSR
jgi:hypothetical protein